MSTAPVSFATTPMLRHYLEVKAQYPDALLMYRMGDFYEMFFEDALLASKALDLTLTRRGKGTSAEAPMCGVPVHAVEGYISRLVRLGHRVAVCDQTADPRSVKGLLPREVVRVVSPGTITDPADDPFGGVAVAEPAVGVELQSLLTSARHMIGLL